MGMDTPYEAECHYCGKVVAHYWWGAQDSRLGSVRHKCPHGLWCPGGQRGTRMTPADPKLTKCQPCRDLLSKAMV